MTEEVKSHLKTKSVTIDIPKEGERENRDGGKTFLLTEMPALRAERWARRAFGAMNRTDLDIKGELVKLGMLGFFLVGLQALAGGNGEEIDKLMDDMLPQIRIFTSENYHREINPTGDDICELSTIARLRKELIELHMGFTFAEAASALMMLAETSAIQPDSPSISTSQT